MVFGFNGVGGQAHRNPNMLCPSFFGAEVESEGCFGFSFFLVRQEQTVLHYMAEAWLAAAGEKGSFVLHVAEDATRLGQPAVSTHLLVAWLADRDAGVYLPPQVQL